MTVDRKVSHLIVYAANESDQAVTFNPGLIGVEGLTKGQWLPLSVFSPEEYESRQRGNRDLRLMFASIGNAFSHSAAALDPDPHRANDALMSDIRLEALKEGTANQLRVEFDSIARRHTVFPSGSYGGHVYFKNRRKVTLYRVFVRYGDTTFRFQFEF